MQLLSKYNRILSKLKGVHVLNNLMHYNQLKRNVDIYSKYGVNKSILSSISNKDFIQINTDTPWLDNTDGVDKIVETSYYKDQHEEMKSKLKAWPDSGYLILENFFEDVLIDAANHDIEKLLKEKSLRFNYTNKRISMAYKKSRIVKEIFLDKRLLTLLSYILGKKIIPFQSINFIEGTEQNAHSDAIHMSTEPKGYLIAAWVALENVNEENGPLFIYPGSHKLPYIMSADFENGNTNYIVGKDFYGGYEKKIASLIEKHQLKKEVFYANKGDVLIWHANLLHGGCKVINKDATRKSQVNHYYCDDVICYHEITQRPAIIDRSLIN